MKLFVEITIVALFFGFHAIEVWKIRKLRLVIEKHFIVNSLVHDWIPHIGQVFYYIGSSGEATSSIWDNQSTEQEIREFMGVYPTREEALQARDRVIHLIKNR